MGSYFEQNLHWFEEALQKRILEDFLDGHAKQVKKIKHQVESNSLSIPDALEKLFKI